MLRHCPLSISRSTFSDFRRVHLLLEFVRIKRGNRVQEVPFALSPYSGTIVGTGWASHILELYRLPRALLNLRLNEKLF